MADNIIIGFGAESNGTYTTVKNKEFKISRQYGILAEYGNYSEFYKHIKNEIEEYKNSYEIIFVCDKHPDYVSTSLAEEFHCLIPDSKLYKVQHHYAHIASVLYENKITENVIGFVFDGTGYGDDGNSWGGEVLLAGANKYERCMHIDYVDQPGSDMVVTEPWRMGISYLVKSNIEYEKFYTGIGKEKVNIIKNMIKNKINCPLTSSAGRLFDAVASLSGVCCYTDTPAGAAIALEKIAAKNIYEFYDYEIKNNSIFFNETIRQIINDLKKDVSSQVISAKFHNTIAKMIFEISIELSKIYSINKVALSGGCFQNKFLMERIKLNFSKSKLKLFTNINLSTTDANISVGQVFIVLTRNSYNDFF